jgi:hypothetical protein
MCGTDWCTKLVLKMSISDVHAQPLDMANRNSVLTVDRPPLQIFLCDAATRLEEEAFASPALAQAARNGHELGALDVVEHYDVRAGSDRLVRLGLCTHLNVEQKRETTDGSCTLDSRGDRACGVCVSVMHRCTRWNAPEDQM